VGGKEGLKGLTYSQRPNFNFPGWEFKPFPPIWEEIFLKNFPSFNFLGFGEGLNFNLRAFPLKKNPFFQTQNGGNPNKGL